MWILDLHKHWIVINKDHVIIQYPSGIFNPNVRILFRDVETIDKTIEQMLAVKKSMMEEAIND